MIHQLWPHQLDAITAAANAFGTDRKAGLWVLPTGTGKTLAFLTLARGLQLPTLVLVHRDELVRQTLATSARVWPHAAVGVIQGRRDDWQDRDLVVASVSSLRSTRLARIPPEQFGLVVVDEAHHLPARSWNTITSHFRPVFLLGCTATPDRLDGKGLATWFGSEPLHTYPLRQAIEDGYLARIRQYAISTNIDLNHVAIRSGDFAVGELGRTVDTEARNRVVVDAYLKHAADRKAVAFAVDLGHVHSLARAFNEAGVRVASVAGTMPTEERRQVLADFAAGRCRVLINCEVLTEGFDERSIDCILMARPTRSRALYQQCIGRGLRLCPEAGKRDCLVLDITDNCCRHKLVTVLDLFGGGEIRDAGGGDVLDVVRNQRTSSPEHGGGDSADLFPLRWRLRKVCPWPVLPSLRGYRPTRAWHNELAPEDRLRRLRKFGFRITRGLTRGEVGCLIERCQRYVCGGGPEVLTGEKPGEWLVPLGRWIG